MNMNTKKHLDTKHDKDIKFDFVAKVGLFGVISGVLTLLSLIYLGIHGLNYGIDFKGGTEIQVRFEQQTSMEELRDKIKKHNLDKLTLQNFGDGSEYLIRFQTDGASEKEINQKNKAQIEGIKTTITADMADKKPEIRRVDSVGPQVGAELQRNSFLAVFYCLLVILIYVAFRFDYKYSPGAVICLFHDAVVTLALYVLIGKEVNIPILAAVLTLIGYSLNDTIVVFDRIRETEAESAEKGLRYIINKSINDMFSRTIITSTTTLVSALCLWLMADGTVSDIAFVLCVGIVLGTYSSIYIAAPFMLLAEKLKAKKA